MNPSYAAPEAMAALATATGDARWSALSAGTAAVVAGLAGPSRATLPSDWVDMAPAGTATAVGSPTGTGAPSYGLDAQRTPVWLASSCTAGDRAVAAGWWTVLGRAGRGGAALSYTLGGRSTAAAVNPMGLVAAAASARSAGHPADAATLLDRADRQAGRFHTYYGDAWTALGRVLLDTGLLGSCPSGA